MRWIDHLYKAKIGGSSDTAALMAMGLSGLASTPVLADLMSPAITANLGLMGTAYLTSRLSEPWRERRLLTSPLRKIPSSPPPAPPPEPHQGILLGYTTDTGQPITIPDEDLTRHLLVVGQSGVGKTVGMKAMMHAQLQRGGGFLWVDGKMAGEDLHELYHILKYYGREHDLLVLNPGNPGMSNTYNPILFGDPDEVAFRALSQIPDTSTSAGADHFKQSANQGVTTLVAALQKAGLKYNFIDLSILLMNPRAMDELETRLLNVSGFSDEAKNLSLFLDQFRVPNYQRPDLGAPVDIKKLKEIFGGIGSRLYQFGTGKFGAVMNSYDPEVNLYDAIMQNKIVYVMLPTMGKDVAAQNFAKMVVGDFRTACSWVQALPNHLKPKIPYMGLFDEAGSYMTENFSRLIEQVRSARISLCIGVQTLANIEAISPELKEMIVGNTWTKIFYKLGTQKTAEEAAELIGYRMGVIRSLSDSTSSSANSPLVGATPEGGVGTSSGLSEGEREQEEYRVRPDDLKALAKGECIVTYGGDSLYHLAAPLFELDKATRRAFGPVKLNHTFRRPVRGADFFRNHDKYLTKYNLPTTVAKKKANAKPKSMALATETEDE